MKMDEKSDHLAILFVDIAKSTHIYEVLGDTHAQNLISFCLSGLTKVTKKYGGVVIKSIGDELMCAFPNADIAVEAAKAMHQEAETLPIPDSQKLPALNLYVGIHCGPVIVEGGDVFGDTVNVAGRLIKLAKQRQIVMTEQTMNELCPALKDTTHCIDETTIKGKSGAFRIYEAVWEMQDVTVFFSSSGDSSSARVPQACLELKFGDKTIEINSTRPMASLGRQDHNDIVVRSESVSRSHARIELRRDKFVLIDQSTNGTYVHLQGKKIFRTRNDEAELSESGVISLGQEPHEESPDVIFFKIK